MSPHDYTIQNVVKPICDIYGVQQVEVLSNKRYSRSVSNARHAIMHFLWKERDWSMPQIAQLFGMHWTSVQCGIGTYEKKHGMETPRVKIVKRRSARYKK